MTETIFHSHANGKLLLTGEYLVLRGATALAMPLKKGQSLSIEKREPSGHPYISWFAYAPDKLWFKTTLELPSLDIIGTDDRPKSAKLQLILLTLKQLNPNLFDGSAGYKIVTRLDFEPQWGLGSSSTLVSNLARWAKIDPYTLLNFSIGGSGYDVACATATKSILYKVNTLRPQIKPANFEPIFSPLLYFVYQGKKQDSTQGIAAFNAQTEGRSLDMLIERVSEISHEAASTDNFDHFCALMDEHEQLMSGVLLAPVIKSQYPDFEGSIKSLGAWGGDFMLVMSSKGPEYIRHYFAKHSLTDIFAYHDLVK
jgi:mevalonate kinase